MALKNAGLILGALCTIALGLAGFVLKWQFEANAEIRALKIELAQVRADKAKDDQQDESLKLLWRYASWSETQIAKLRHNAGMEPADRPTWD